MFRCLCPVSPLLRSAAVLALGPGLAGVVQGGAVTRKGSGITPAALQGVVDQFRADLGGANNGVGGTFKTGRREINWDGVPDNFSAPHWLPGDFFNSNSPRGIRFTATTTFGENSAFMVSADSSNPDSAPVRFGNINPDYTSIYTAFSSQRLFAARSSRTMDVQFFVPGTAIPATVTGFGAVFCDVDQTGPTYVRYLGTDGGLLLHELVPAANNGLSFLGVSFNAGERVARVQIISGTQPMGAAVDDTGGSDVVALDDFIYGEPVPFITPVPAEAGFPSTLIEAHVPMSLTPAPAQQGVPQGYFRTFLRCSPHHTYRFYSSTDLVNWSPALLSGKTPGPGGNLLDPREGQAWQAATLSVQADLFKSGPNLFYRAVDEGTNEQAISPLVP